MENSYNFILVLYTCTANYLLCCKYEHCWIIILLVEKAKKKNVGGEIFFEYKKYRSILSVFIYFPTWLSLLKNYPNEPT